MVCLLSNDEIKIRILGMWQLMFIMFIFQDSIEKSGLVDGNTN